MVDLVSQIPDNEGVMVGGDLNGHVGKERGVYSSALRGFGYGGRNEEGKRILEFAVALNLRIGNTWFKREEDSCLHMSLGETKV